MSAPVCLRATFGACRPTRTAQLPLRSALTHHRTYADKSSPKIQGVPKTGSKKERKEILDDIPTTAPPKRTTPPVAEAAAPTVQPAPSPSSTTLETSPSTTELSLSTSTQEQSPQQNRPVPSNVIASYRRPLKHTPPHGVPVASLQLRSFSVRSLEFFSDFALRAAYYLNLPATGPVPLPKRIERWTVLRSNFVNKKAQENFERITMKRLITIMDGEKSAVEVWLAVLRKYQFYGVGMKANVWEWEGLDVAARMDAGAKELQKDVEAKLANFGWNKHVAGSRSLQEALQKQGPKHAGVPMMDVRDMSPWKKRVDPEEKKMKMKEEA